MTADPRISHMVYFALEDNSAQAIAGFLADMKNYLDHHDGLEFFACGVVTPDLSRPVNDKAFDVSLHTIFTNRAAHDVYQVAERHLEFIARNKANWKQVRVFDSNLEPRNED